MKKIGFVLIALVFLPLNAQAETMLNPAESFQIARSVKMGRKTSISSPFHNKDIMKNGGGTNNGNSNNGDKKTPFEQVQIRCPAGQYYNEDEKACKGVCYKVECYWGSGESDDFDTPRYLYVPQADGDSCKCVRSN